MPDDVRTPAWRTRPQRVGTPSDPRFSFANERTFLAWNRTALTLIGGGLAASQLLHLRLGEGRLVLALAPIALGAALVIAGLARWRTSELALRLRTPVPRSPYAPVLLGVGAAVLAVVSIALLVIGEAR